MSDCDTPTSSSTPSRSGTPLPSRLVIPPASGRHTPLQSHGSSPYIQPATDLESSASSVINLDISDGILVHDVDAEVETMASEETTAVGQIDDIADEQSRKTLRDQLRRTLTKKEHTGLSLSCLGMSASKYVPAPRSPLAEIYDFCHRDLFHRWSVIHMHCRLFRFDIRRHHKIVYADPSNQGSISF